MTAPKPSPSVRRRQWVVHGSNGSETVFLADYHRTTERKDGLELQFMNRDEHIDRRVGSVRPGAWHWVAEESALVEEDSDA